jgi:hypothetical protein
VVTYQFRAAAGHRRDSRPDQHQLTDRPGREPCSTTAARTKKGRATSHEDSSRRTNGPDPGALALAMVAFSGCPRHRRWRQRLRPARVTERSDAASEPATVLVRGLSLASGADDR